MKLRKSTSFNRSYTDPEIEDLPPVDEDPISSDDPFTDPMYVAEDDASTSDTSIYEDTSPAKQASKKKAIPKDSYELRKCDMERAIEEIKRKGKRKAFLSHLSTYKRGKILDLCARDPKIGTKNTVGGSLTKTQQILYHLNRCVLKHDWSSVATLIDYMLNLNGKLLPVIWKSVFLVLFNHPNSTPEKIDNFLQMCIGLRTETDKTQFLKELFTLPEDLTKYKKPSVKTKPPEDDMF